ncbi:hypothetical protein BGW80DRAFT_321345 [Lactifluus volemus]|nr:hypothetical protein BGW80DRAFT_321345 [Lactifluus volemus]
MDGWVIFRRARIILFSFLVLLCITWTTLFSVFAVREWQHFSHFQRIIIVFLLSLYGATTILLYLMIVVHFQFWWEFGRAIALLLVHVASSLLFTHFSPGFPCRGFKTQTTCREFVFTIFIGCWVFSGIVGCFAVILGIMAFVPRPVESSSEEKGGESSPNTAPGKGNEERPLTFHSIDSRTGLVAYENQGGIAQDWNPPDHVKGPANGIRQVTFSTESSPFRDPTTPPGRTYSRDSTIITGTEMGNPAFVQNMPKQWPFRLK